jgi:hypothetical protein
MGMSVRDANIFIEEYVKIKKGEVNDTVCVSKQALQKEQSIRRK